MIKVQYILSGWLLVTIAATVHCHVLYEVNADAYNQGERMVRVAINGLGRIGRNFLRCVMSSEVARKHIDIVAINIGPAKKEFVAHMFTYDTLMGTFGGTVALEGDFLTVNGHKIKIIAERDPAAIDWKGINADWVVECTGFFTKRDGAQKHIQAGARHVLISAPAQDEDISIVPGINHAEFNGQEHKIVSLGSCTTNAFLPMIKILDDAYGIVRGFMTTIHAYTNNQVLLDVETDDLRRSRAAALNIIPTSTGVAGMIPKLMPHLHDCISAISIRVPVGKVSLVDFVCELKKDVTAAEIKEVFYTASRNQFNGIVATTDEELVSSDFGGSNFSVTIDQSLTQVTGNAVKIFGWYDNEWGYSMRLMDFLIYVAQSN